MTTRSKFARSPRPRRCSALYFFAGLERLEDRTTPTGTLYLAPTSIAYAMVGRDYLQTIAGYGPDTLSNGPYNYSVPSGTDLDGLTFTQKDNVSILSGKPSKKGAFSLTVNVSSDSGQNLGTQDYMLNVGDAPTTGSLKLLTTDLAPNLAAGVAGQPFGHYLHAAGGTGDYTYDFPATSVDGVTFSPYGDTITVSGTPTTAGSFPFTIGIRNSDGSSGSSPFMLNVSMGLFPGDQFDANGDLPTALVGADYRQPITALGGTGKLTFTNPAKVGDLTLTVADNALILAGKPLTPGTFSFSIIAIDTDNHRVQHDYTLSVADDPVNLEVLGPQTPAGIVSQSLSTTSLIAAQVNEPYSQTFAAVGGDGQYTFHFPNYPSGTVNGLSFTLNGSSLVLSGTPSTAGTFGYLLAVTDGTTSSSPPQQYWLNVSPAVPAGALTLAPNGQINLPGGSENVQYSQNFTAYGAGSYAFTTLATTRLPLGMHFDVFGSSYILSGTPLDSGTFPIAIQVASNGQTVEEDYVLTIAPSSPLTLTRQLLGPTMQGFPYTQNLVSDAQSAYYPSIDFPKFAYLLTAAGGSGQGYRFTATGLPPGMVLYPSGQLAGAPTVLGDYTIKVTVTDSAGNKSSMDYPLPVIPCPPFPGDPFFEFANTTYQANLARQAYGFDKIVLSGGVIGTGKGQTIAVIENSDQSTFVSSIPGLTLDRPDQVSYANSDLARFSTAYNLPQFGATAGGDAPVFVKLFSDGTTDYPINPGNNGEFAEDVSTIHTLAPEANIVVFVAPPGATDFDLAQIYQTAMSFPNNLPNLPVETKEALANLPPVSVVSSSVYNSFVEYLNELNEEKFFTAPFPATQPATVVIAAGDTGNFPPTITTAQYPGNSGQVISAAMTQPLIGNDGKLLGELGVDNAGGGASLYLPQPTWQNGVVGSFSATTRVAPDVGMIGGFNSAMTILESGNWGQANGSSNAAPAWSALVAIMNQGRALLGEAPFNGPTETLPQLYQLPASDFHKISQLDDGTNVPANFNTQAGLGTPVTNRLVPDMLGGLNTIQGTVSETVTGSALAGWTVYLDANQDGVFEPGVEGSAVTGEDGTYTLLVSPGSSYLVRVQPPTGIQYLQTSGNPGAIAFTVGSDHTIASLDFAFSSDSTTLFVAKLYESVLKRTGSSPEIAGWVQAIAAGASRELVGQSFWQSPEHRGLQVDGFYAAYLQRQADPSGRSAWVQALVAGSSEIEVSLGFLTSSEFISAHPGSSSYVTALYNDVLDRAPDPSGLAGWVALLDVQHATPAAVADQFLTCNEKYSDLLVELYSQLLDRLPDPAGDAYWLDQLQTGQATQDQVAEALLASDEFFQHGSKR